MGYHAGAWEPSNLDLPALGVQGLPCGGSQRRVCIGKASLALHSCCLTTNILDYAANYLHLNYRFCLTLMAIRLRCGFPVPGKHSADLAPPGATLAPRGAAILPPGATLAPLGPAFGESGNKPVNAKEIRKMELRNTGPTYPVL